MTDKERFSEVCDRIINTGHPREGIGTLGEKSVHYALKSFFEEDPVNREVRVGKYVADIKNGSVITEIQSSGFGAMKRKLEDYLCSDDISQVNIVHPIIENKRVIKISPETGEISREYSSPRHVKPAEIFKELLFLGDCVYSDKLRFILVSLEIDEVSFDTSECKKVRGKSYGIDKIPKNLLRVSEYDSIYDMGNLFPYADGERVTASMIKRYLRSSGRKNWAAIKIMENAGYLVRSGKEGNKIVYTFIKNPHPNKTES